MEGLSPLHRRVAGIDVHRMLHVATALIENDDATIVKHQKEFGGFKRDMKAMAAWLFELKVTLVVMESTGIYWKSAHAHLEHAGILTMIVNAHFIKYVPGRKKDMGDSEWLAVLARFGLMRGSFILPKDLRELRLISRYRSKLSQMLSRETNRMHKMTMAASNWVRWCPISRACQHVPWWRGKSKAAPCAKCSAWRAVA